MTRDIQLTPDAVADIDRALAYYATIRIELLLELQDEFDSFFDLLSERPLTFQTHAGAIRRVFLAKFPYGVFYVVDDTTVTVLAVFHLADDPETLEVRLKGSAG